MFLHNPHFAYPLHPKTPFAGSTATPIGSGATANKGSVIVQLTRGVSRSFELLVFGSARLVLCYGLVLFSGGSWPVAFR